MKNRNITLAVALALVTASGRQEAARHLAYGKRDRSIWSDPAVTVTA